MAEALRFVKGYEELLTPLQVQYAQDWLNAYFIAQHRTEFTWMLSYLTGCKSMLEIGSRFGLSTLVMASKLDKHSTVVAVDWPNHEGADDNMCYGNIIESVESLKSNMRKIHDMGHKTHLLLGDSHTQEVVSKVKALGPYDFIFIDGDHSDAGVRADFENYGKLSKTVAFHDIAKDGACHLFWNELRSQYRTEECVDSGNMGIGIVFKESYAYS